MIHRDKCPVCQAASPCCLYSESYATAELRGYLQRMYPTLDHTALEQLADECFELSECSHCRFIYQSHIPCPATMQRLYEEWIDPHAAAEFDRHRSALVYGEQCAELTVLLDSLGLPSRTSVLDFGMGWANWCQLARGFGCRVAGVELSPSRIAHAARLGIGLPDDSDQFELVHADQVLEHVAHPQEEICQLRDRLAPGGILHVNVPDCRSIKRRIHRFRWDAPRGSKNSLQIAAPLEHINCFTRESLTRVAMGCGLVVDAERTKRVVRAGRRGLRKLRTPAGTNLVFAKAA